ncbi:hypothetical protein Taro_014459 [Colocasia esculenta]|uniref:Glycosyltransferase n=1 Tax=Colocasia esculenta TaxID=4460 RepID=A0A843UET9_COLES|nr:hypothetical protein [Colocasia esculenta]
MAPMPPPHVLILPYPSQGHINPMLQFAKRLVSRGPKATLVTTHFIISSVQTKASAVAFASISDGYDEGGVLSADSLDEYFRNLAEVGSRTLAEFIEAQRAGGEPFTCMVYDTYAPWACEVAARLGLPAVAFSTQSCAASAIYYYVNRALLPVPGDGSHVSVDGLPPMSRSEFPSFVARDGVYYPTLTDLSLGQFNHLEKADWVLFNSIEELESEVLAGLKAYRNARTIGPTVPSMFIDRSIDGDDCYSVNLLQADDACVQWLDDKPPASVVYVSFGSFATLNSEQTAELAYGLRDAGHAFLWVLRASEQGKLPAGFLEEVGERGRVVGWCPQLKVLAHGAVGCFVSHCGWNSTLEALSLGVPMVAVPQWTDQPTNAKMVEEVWGVGVRATHGGGEQVLLSRAEICGCVSQVMIGKRAQEMRSNAVKWKETVRGALGGGGSSDRNMVEFVEFLNSIKAKTTA